MALWALADFDRSGLVAPSLFDALASLQRPSWGSWIGLITGLRIPNGHCFAAERTRIATRFVSGRRIQFTSINHLCRNVSAI